jgi:aspartate-semialdehyde dehydrogenase
VLRCHALDITVKTRGPVDLDEYKSILENEPMLELKDDLENLDYPMPINTTGKYPVAVGRLRHPVVFENGVRMFVSGDQLLRGAALNAVLIVKKIYDYLSWP